MDIELKTTDEIAVMREAGIVVFEVLEELEKLVEPGVTLEELDQAAKRETERRGASCAFNSSSTTPGSTRAQRSSALTSRIGIVCGPVPWPPQLAGAGTALRGKPRQKASLSVAPATPGTGGCPMLAA